MSNPFLGGFDKSLYRYLGHFAQPKFLRQGHNEMPDPDRVGHTAVTMKPTDLFIYQSGRTIGGSTFPMPALQPPANTNTRLGRIK